MDKKWVLEILTQIEDRVDFPPKKGYNHGGFQPLLTPETYNLIREKYGLVPPIQKQGLETEINNIKDNILVKVSYLRFENEALKRENQEKEKKIGHYEKLLKYKDSRINRLNNKIKRIDR